MNDIAFTVVFILFMAGVFFSWFFIHRAKSKERLMLIEKGSDPTLFFQSKKITINFPWLKIGIVLAGMGIGLLFGSISSNPGLILGSVFLFGGIGMVIANYLDKPKVQK